MISILQDAAKVCHIVRYIHSVSYTLYRLTQAERGDFPRLKEGDGEIAGEEENKDELVRRIVKGG